MFHSSINFHQPRLCALLNICGVVVLICGGAIQCSWTPHVETPIYSSAQGSIALQTSSAFKVPPQHPQFLSESLMTRILQGMSRSQESGLLQETFLSTPDRRPVFSETQIKFLAPQIVAAFAQATPEERIAFQMIGDEDRTTHLSGTATIFSPAIFFLTLKDSVSYSRKSSKMAVSSRHLLNQTMLHFSEEQAVLPQEDAKRLMKTSFKDPWVAINYATLKQTEERRTQEVDALPDTPISFDPTPKGQPETNTLQKQLQDLQNTVDEQAKQIQELQKTSP